MGIFDVKPHVVSRTLKGYSVMLYGDPKSGKTTTATRFPKHLLLAFEKGYSAIPGAMALPVNSWGEFLKYLRELKKPEAHDTYETIIVDTADIAWDYCGQYVCAQNNVDKINQIPYGGGHAQLKKEFDKQLRSIVQMGYGLVLISHSVAKPFMDPRTGVEYDRMVPTLPNGARIIVNRLCDIIGYSTTEFDDEGRTITKLKMRGTPCYDAGSRFTYTPDEIVFNYDNLVNAIGDAIDKQAQALGQTELFTDSGQSAHVGTVVEYNFDELMADFNNHVNRLMTANISNQPKIAEIVERHLGIGNKVAEMSRNQAEVLATIVDELTTL